MVFLILLLQLFLASNLSLADTQAHLTPEELDNLYIQKVWTPPDHNFKSIQVFAHMRSGNQSLMDDLEVGTLTWKNGKWHLNIKIGVWGVSSFSRVKNEDLKKARKWQQETGEPNPIEEQYFKKTFENLRSQSLADQLPKSFNDIPEIARLIQKQLKSIERLFNTDFLSTKFEVQFIDESQLVDAQTWQNPDNISPLIAKKIFNAPMVSEKFLPLKYSPIPNTEFITPGEADPYTWPELMAHEIFHLLSRNHMNDGFPFSNYPLEGIMNGGEQMKVRQSVNGQARLLALEFNTLLVEQMAYQDRTSNHLDIAEKLGVPSYYTEAILSEHLAYYSSESSDKDAEIGKQLDRYKRRSQISINQYHKILSP